MENQCRRCLLASALLAAGCMQFEPGEEGSITLATHVTDWREEVIYQLVVDRFADGDAGNNFRVDTLSPGKWHGGDWKGVEDKLDYLSELGVTTLWISPVVKNVDTDAGFDGYHGYWAQDLMETNPHFGNLPALRRMVARAHDRGMKVILDIVTNHLGQLFYYDINMNGEPDERVRGSGFSPNSPVIHVNEYDPDFDPRGIQASTSLGESGPAPIIFVYDPATNHVPPLPEIFQVPEAYNRKGRTYNFEDPDQLLHGDFPGGLKDVNTELCEVRQAMVDVYARWVELTDVDGFRIDTVKHVERGFWRYFAQKVRQRLADRGKRNFFMFGEAFDGRDNLVGAFTKNGNDDPPSPADLEWENRCVHDGIPLSGDQLDGVFYFPQYFQAVRDVLRYRQGTAGIESLWNNKTTSYGITPAEGGTGLPPTKTLVSFLDNHDVPRFLWDQNFPDYDRFKMGLLSDADFKTLRMKALKNALLLIFTAEGIPCLYYGTEQALEGGNDPANREDLWATGYDQSGEIFQFIRRLAELRKRFPTLAKGALAVTWASDRHADEPDAGIFAYERTGGDGYALVVINTNADHDSSPIFNASPMTISQAPGTVLVDVLGTSGQTYTVSSSRQLVITLPPLSGVLLIPQTEVQ